MRQGSCLYHPSNHGIPGSYFLLNGKRFSYLFSKHFTNHFKSMPLFFDLSVRLTCSSCLVFLVPSKFYKPEFNFLLIPFFSKDNSDLSNQSYKLTVFSEGKCFTVANGHFGCGNKFLHLPLASLRLSCSGLLVQWTICHH